MSGISFFMPAYNCEKTVEESIESIFKENFHPEIDELVIVNDCSTDGTLAVLNKVKLKYPQLLIINNPRNKGGAATRNIAVENTKNELLFCLDSDNVLESNSIPPLKNKLLSEEADIAAFQEIHYFVDSIKKITHKWSFDPVIWDASYLLSHTQNPPSSGNYLFTKASWLKANGYPEFAGALDTWGFGVRQLFSDSKLVICTNSYYFHRYGYDSYWVRDSKNGKISLTALQILIPFFAYIDETSINYMMSKDFRYTWHSNIDKTPIKVLKEKKTIFSAKKINLLSTLKQKLIHIFSS